MAFSVKDQGDGTLRADSFHQQQLLRPSLLLETPEMRLRFPKSPVGYSLGGDYVLTHGGPHRELFRGLFSREKQTGQLASSCITLNLPCSAPQKRNHCSSKTHCQALHKWWPSVLDSSANLAIIPLNLTVPGKCCLISVPAVHPPPTNLGAQDGDHSFGPHPAGNWPTSVDTCPCAPAEEQSRM